MSNPMKYIRDLEAAGFQRNQAEAQVQMVLDAIEGDRVTKSEFAVFKEHQFDLSGTRFQSERCISIPKHEGEQNVILANNIAFAQPVPNYSARRKFAQVLGRQ